MRATAARTGGAGPFIVGVAGSVAVGKSRTAQLLQALLKSRPDRPSVDIVTTDGFIYPRAELVRRGLLGRKGFPESYDLRWLTQFLSDVRTSGCGAAPVYSHHAYDRIPGEHWVRNPDILIVEGVNVLQIEGASIPAGQAGNPFDLSIYLDADTDDIARWYEDRFLSQQNTAFRQPASPFHHLADASIEDARAAARELWTRINAINLVENILPTRPCADVILCKGPDHAVRHLWLRPLREVR
jgi:type I pantothenate kinase